MGVLRIPTRHDRKGVLPGRDECDIDCRRTAPSRSRLVVERYTARHRRRLSITAPSTSSVAVAGDGTTQNTPAQVLGPVAAPHMQPHVDADAIEDVGGDSGGHVLSPDRRRTAK